MGDSFVGIRHLVLVLVLILDISFLSAGYEHVQQRSGVRAARAFNEPVWFACRGRRRREQRRSVFCPHRVDVTETVLFIARKAHVSLPR